MMKDSTTSDERHPLIAPSRIAVKVDEAEKEKYPILCKDGEYYTERLDVDNAMEFGQFEFLDACKAMGIVKDGVTDGVFSTTS